jgi:hypothetical protein
MAGISGINIDVGQGLGQAGSFLKDIRTAITGKAPLDPNKAAELESKMIDMEHQLMMAQADINKVEAANPSLWIAGWRPGVGWICVAALFWNFIGHPIMTWAVAIGKISITPPSLDTGSLLTVLFAMLGMGTLRTVEKIKGAEANR